MHIIWEMIEDIFSTGSFIHDITLIAILISMYRNASGLFISLFGRGIMVDNPMFKYRFKAYGDVVAINNSDNYIYKIYMMINTQLSLFYIALMVLTLGDNIYGLFTLVILTFVVLIITIKRAFIISDEEYSYRYIVERGLMFTLYYISRLIIDVALFGFVVFSIFKL